MKIGIKILPRKEILDPLGRAVQGSLQESGFKLHECRVGKYIVLDVPQEDLNSARAEIQKMANHVLYNPLTETYEIEAL